MDDNTSRLLGDRLYDRRKSAAQNLERTVRQLLAQNTPEAYEQISKIIDQICQDYAYAVHQTNARNGGSIGLAAVAIALGSNHIATFLDRIIMPVLACFSDQAAQVRYYACEALYNIAKVAKGEILVYFNDIFDVLCRSFADSENSIKNGANLFNRLIKDIVSEKAATYVSVINKNTNDMSFLLEGNYIDSNGYHTQINPKQKATAFSLEKFIPILKERLFTNNPYTRLFLVDWIMLLDSVPDLQLISYLPNFLNGLLTFLTDPRKDVRLQTSKCLNTLLEEIKKIVEVKRFVEKEKLLKLERDDKKKKLEDLKRVGAKKLLGTNPIRKNSTSVENLSDAEIDKIVQSVDKNKDVFQVTRKMDELDVGDVSNEADDVPRNMDESIDDSDESLDEYDDSDESEEDDSYYGDIDGEVYVPLQDVHISFPEIIRILISNLDNKNEEVQMVVLNWIETLIGLTPSSFIPLICDLLEILVGTISSNESNKSIQEKAKTIDKKLKELVYLYLDVDEEAAEENKFTKANSFRADLGDTSKSTPGNTSTSTISMSGGGIMSSTPNSATAGTAGSARKAFSPQIFKSSVGADKQSTENDFNISNENAFEPLEGGAAEVPSININSSFNVGKSLPTTTNTEDYANRGLLYSDTKTDSANADDSHAVFDKLVTIVNDNLLKVNDNTKLLLLDWLIMLHKKSSKLFLAHSLSKTFNILLKSLCGESTVAVEKDITLISEISLSANDALFYQLMLDLTNLFEKEPALLSEKGNFILKKICSHLDAERVYKSLAQVLHESTSKDHGDSLRSEMITLLNNNLMISSELKNLREKLRNINIVQSKEDYQLFHTLFQTWSYNAPACLSLCLLTQNYELAFNILKIMTESEITVNLLIQIDVLVQLLESPVFVKLRFQLLEPEKYPFLLKCLYGILMILPQSSAFHTLQRRLNTINCNLGTLSSSYSNQVGSPSTSSVPFVGPSSNSNSFGSAGKLSSSKKSKHNELLKVFQNNVKKL